ncbi:MAG: dephospho-CoA kinase [Chloroflexi bacterium]|nr:dephospho-CoA kinase [Chloroflexota bacterium]MDA8187139.1 dephospho-CoA kinase [Dehalococcoidales bacterium]
MIVIGLTGNIACGKSLISKMLQELGARVIDADKVAHQLMAPHTETWKRIVAEFGEGILTPENNIDRVKLGSIVFTDSEALAKLENIIHPGVSDYVEQAIREGGAPAIVIEAIKLIEAGLHKRCDSVWVVTCRREQQIQRLMRDRHMSRQAALVRLRAQSAPKEKIKFADVVIDNSGTPEYVWEQVKREWERLFAKQAAEGTD